VSVPRNYELVIPRRGAIQPWSRARRGAARTAHADTPYGRLREGPTRGRGRGLGAPTCGARRSGPCRPTRASGQPLTPRPRRLALAELPKRTFAVDVQRCVHSGGRSELLAVVMKPESVAATLLTWGWAPMARGEASSAAAGSHLATKGGRLPRSRRPLRVSRRSRIARRTPQWYSRVVPDRCSRRSYRGVWYPVRCVCVS
jgi:hypothetical protein